MKPQIIIVDGKNLLWRNCDAFRGLSARVDGIDIHTGGMYGFVSGLIRIHARYRGRIIVAWEGTQNFRHELYPQYKRKGGDKSYEVVQKQLAQEVRDSEGRLNELLSHAGVRQYCGIRCEADDVMGTIATIARKKRLKVAIYTSDSDLRQLVRPGITVISPARQGDVIYDSDAVIKRHGVEPDKLPIVKALGGDSSDNIPGLPKIGEKTAICLVNHYGSLSKITSAAMLSTPLVYERGAWPVHDRFKKIVLENRESARLFLVLTTIKTNVKLKRVPVQRDKSEVVRLLNLYKFRSLSSAAELMSIMELGQ